MLLDQLAGDVVYSPYGLNRALSVIRDGATGETRRALEPFERPPEVPGVISAQAAWLHPDYRPGPKLTLETGPLDLDAINAWSAERTRGMVPKILDSLGESEIAVITDAEYLKAKWRHPFEAARPALFEGAGEVPMMRVEGEFEHAEDAVRLPYAEHDLRLVAMLGEWHEVQWRRASEGVVALPRFTTESSLELDKVLGLALPFGHDLDALIDGPGEKGFGRIVQRARVDVDEEGTEAAATTAVTIRAVSFSPPFHLTFDRPFTWAIEHAPTRTVLFAGRVVNPTSRRD
jgi:serine protease inhibitor